MITRLYEEYNTIQNKGQKETATLKLSQHQNFLKCLSSIFIPSDCAHFSISLRKHSCGFFENYGRQYIYTPFMQVKVRVLCHFSHRLAQNITNWERVCEREKESISQTHTHCWLLNEWKGSVLSVCNSLISCSEEVQPNGSSVSFMMPELMALCVLNHWTFIVLSCHHNFFLRHEQLDKRNAQNKSSIELWVIGEESE